jgi:DNA helicase-2/ATP-dependent DNA helicase PcrA
MDGDRLLDGLNQAQRRAVTTSVVPLAILAGAGSGKTRVLTRRIAYRAATGQHDPRRVLALTFTRKAAGELTARLRRLELRDTVAAGTFHAVAYAQLRGRWADRNIQPPTLLTRKVGFVGRLMPTGRRAGTGKPSASRRSGPSGRPGPGGDMTPLDVVAEIEWAKARRVTPEHYPSAAKAARRDPGLPSAEVAAIFERYETDKRARRMIDFDDLLSLCVRDLQRDHDFAEAQRWRYRHFFVDEYQDVNPLQQALLEAWLGDRTDLCVVGDPQQAIYAWNGADARHLTGFTQRWQRGEVVRLSENYRSSPQILAAANAVLAGSRSAGRAPAGGRDDAGTGPDGLVANRPDGPLPSIRSFADDRAEAAGIARAVRDHHRPGAPWSSQAILVRTNAQTAVLEAALRAGQIPCHVRGGSSLLDRPEVKAALRDLEGRQEPLAAAVADLQMLARRATGTDSASRSLPPGEAAADSAQGDLEELVRLAHDYAALDSSASATSAGFCAWLTETSRADHPHTETNAVDIATFHSAKGLEWPTVHLAGLEHGLVPIGNARTPAELAEERRLFYVALTRAEREVCCTWAEQRSFGTRQVARERSPYLAHVEAAGATVGSSNDAPIPPVVAVPRVRAAAARPAPGDGPTRQRVVGALSGVDPGDRVVLDALLAWRAASARAASVPPSALFDDAALEAVASARPRTFDELRAVSGIGTIKARRYGDALLGIVAVAVAEDVQPEGVTTPLFPRIN